VELVVTQLNFLKELMVGLCIKRRISTKKAVGNHTYTPHVASFIIGAVQDFRSHVVGSANSRSHKTRAFSVRTLRLKVFRKTEIDQLDLSFTAFAFKKNVLWLQISMADVFVM